MGIDPIGTQKSIDAINRAIVAMMPEFNKWVDAFFKPRPIERYIREKYGYPATLQE
jgi:hypothetical protein